jgi:hypothetical protein
MIDQNISHKCVALSYAYHPTTECDDGRCQFSLYRKIKEMIDLSLNIDMFRILFTRQ